MQRKPRSTKPLISFYMEEDLLAQVDAYRRDHPDLPPRSTAIKELLRRGLNCPPPSRQPDA